MDLSIIIVSFNTKDVLRNCLNSVLQHAGGLNVEIIVIDNDSSDGSLKMVREEFPSVQLIANTVNAGFAKANNQGIKIAMGRHILLLNSDTIIFDDSLLRVYHYMQSLPAVGVLGCKILNKDRTLQYSCWNNPSVVSEWVMFAKTILKDCWDPWTYCKCMKYWDHNSIKAVDCLSGCFLWIRKDVIDQIGMLDEDFFMYYEDFEFCYRVKHKTDFQVLYYPNVAIIHLGQMSANPENFSLAKHCFESVQQYFKKCQGRFQAGLFKGLCVVTWHVEMVLLFFLSFHPKVQKKLKMLMMLNGYKQ